MASDVRGTDRPGLTDTHDDTTGTTSTSTKAPFTQDADHLATTSTKIMEHTVANGSVHTARKQHQRICVHICMLPRPV